MKRDLSTPQVTWLPGDEPSTDSDDSGDDGGDAGFGASFNTAMLTAVASMKTAFANYKTTLNTEFAAITATEGT